MRITNTEKLKMCKEHVIEKKTLSYVSERYGNYNLGGLKYLKAERLTHYSIGK